MDEDRAAAPGDARACVVVNFDNQIIELIITPKTVAGIPPGKQNVAVVAPVVRVFAPGVLRADSARRKGGGRPRQAIRPPPQPQQPESAARRCAITFALVGQNAAAPQRDRKRLRTGDQHGARACGGGFAHVNGAERSPHAGMPFSNRIARGINNRQRLRFVARMFYFAQP